MRISTSTFYNASLSGIQGQQSQIAKLSQKVAENKSYLTPKEAPLAASRALDLSNSLAVRKQFAANQDRADLTLKYESVALDQLRTSLVTARSIVRSVTPGQEQSLQDQYAIQLSNLYSLAKDIGNTRDAEGNFIFSGHETATLPYAHTATYPASLPVVPPTFPANPSSYSGDTGVRDVQVENGRRIQTSDSLDTVFRAGAADDLLQQLDYAAAALRDPNVSNADVQTAMDSATAAINQSLNNLQGIQTQVSGRFLEINDLRASTDNLINVEENSLGELKELDLAAAIIELQQRQTNLEASQRTFALVSSLSLFNFLS